jgi:hypothetical protein
MDAGLGEYNASDSKIGYLRHPMKPDHALSTIARRRLARDAVWLIVAAACAASSPCFAQDRDQAQQTISPDNAPDEQTLITREEWQKRIEAAKSRLRQQRAHGLGLRPAKSDQEIEQDNADRVMSDDMLKPGDIVSTNKGLLTFKGRPTEGRTPADGFVPAPR